MANIIEVTVPNGPVEVVTVQVPGAPGPAGPSANLSIGTVAAGSAAAATITGITPNQVLNLTLPKGDKGDAGPQGIQGIPGVKGDPGDQGPQGIQGIPGPKGDQGIQGVKGDTGNTGPAGPANTLSIGTVAGGASAAATITGTAPNQVLNLTLPKGDPGTPGADGAPGPTNTLTIGTVTTGTPSATLTGTSPNQVLNLVLPAGAGVIAGGLAGDVLVKTTNADYDTSWSSPSSAATANALMKRDSAGRAQVADPSVNADIATKGYVDNTAGTATGTANTLVRRDGGAGTHLYRLLIDNTAAPTSNADVTRKDYVDSQDSATRRIQRSALPAAGAAYTLALTDEGKQLYSADPTNTTVTIPTNATVAFPVGAWVEFQNVAGGSVTLSGAAGVTLSAADGSLTTRTVRSVIRALKTNTDTWAIYGDNVSATDSTVNAATSAATASALMKRDASGRAQAADPSASADIVTKNWLDSYGALNKVSTWTAGTNVTPSATWLPGTQVWTLTTNLTIAAFPTSGGQMSGKAGEVVFILKQSATGGCTVTWPSGITWIAGSAPVMPSAANAVQKVVLYWDGLEWFGSVPESDISTRNYVDGKTWPSTAINDSTATGRSLITAADATTARAAIGAGTSSLVLGTTSTTAKAGDYQPTSANITDAASAATANVVVKRDASGRAQVADPAVAADIATKNYVDTADTALQGQITTNTNNISTNTTKLNAATSSPTASQIVLRDVNGRAQVADPSASGDIATKNYVDTQDATKQSVSGKNAANGYVGLDASSNASIAGTTTASMLRLTSTGDASTTSTTHAFQVGPDTGLNIIIDQNEIIARNNGVLANFGVGGGRITSVGTPTSTGDAATKGYVDGLFKSGITTATSNTSSLITVTHGFSVAPTAVVCTPQNATTFPTTLSVSAITATTFTVKVYYNNAAAPSASTTFYWAAFA
jgi:hypothetical protein